MADHTAIREKLEQRLAQLEDRTKRIASDLRRPGDPDWPDRAIQRENDEVLERLGEAELAEISLIRAALTRLEEGRYGRCRKCAAEIEPARLEAIPYADRCVACADEARST